MENTNIKSISNLIYNFIELEVEYADNVIIDTKNYSKMGNDNIQKLVSEVEIEKLVFLGYFDNQ